MEIPTIKVIVIGDILRSWMGSISVPLPHTTKDEIKKIKKLINEKIITILK